MASERSWSTIHKRQALARKQISHEEDLEDF
jgi:hypothetical protein